MSEMIFIPDEKAMLDFGAKLAGIIASPALVFLQGDLGAGKSTLVRGFMHGLGFQGRVKSPTYTLVEPYEMNDKTIYHMDLYRLADPEELEFIGIRDILSGTSLCMIEWPEKAGGMLGEPDISIKISSMDTGRNIKLSGLNEQAMAVINEL